MDPLEHALDVATRMRQALQAELDEAREQRVLVRKLDVQGLFERARRRGEFNVKLAQMQDELGGALVATARVLGVDRVSLDVLHTSGIHAGQQGGASAVRAAGVGAGAAGNRCPQPSSGQACAGVRARYTCPPYRHARMSTTATAAYEMTVCLHRAPGGLSHGSYSMSS